MQDPKDYSEIVPAAERDVNELVNEGIKHLEQLRAQNDMVERMLTPPKIVLIKSRGFYTRHVRSRKERVSSRKAQKAARKANR